ncbi:hypothetical protein [Roseateles sp. P5_E11]
MDVVHREEVVKCPGPACQHPIHISVGRWPGGINDSGGWVLKCGKCSHVFPVSVKNPDDASRVDSGATILDSWDNEMGNQADVLAAHGVTASLPQPDRLMLLRHGEPEEFYDLQSRPLYRCGACKRGLEDVAYAVLAASLAEANRGHSSYLNWYLATRGGPPEGISVRLKATCACGAQHRVRFYRPFSERVARAASEYWLVDAEGLAPTLDVDGIYTRDDCITILEKLLLRWRAMHSAVLLAAPFIGFNYPGARKKIPELWNWVLKYTDPNKTSVITRKATFRLMKEVAKDSEDDIEFLKSWGLLNPTLAALDEKKAFFKTDFHAKFYCGMSADNVEILVGSFNIHEGTYVENIHLLRYTFDEFRDRYLLGMKMFFDVGVLAARRTVLEIFVADGKLASYDEVTVTGSLLT